MKISLFDFQEAALSELREKVALARQVASVRNAQAISFSAPTGSGKTIVLTALIENIFFGEAMLAPQSDAVILWVSDMPQLNEQSRLKIEGKSDRIRTRQLVTIDSSTFGDAFRLEGGHIYFVNTQKLGEDKLLTSHGNQREYTIWETISNTASAIPDRFYVVIDEAHRGMREGKGSERAATIMQRFLKGSAEHNLIRMPLVIGMSATPHRFEQMLAGTTYTTHKVYVAAKDVRESGLVKDRIVIRFPEETSEAEMSLVRESATTWLEMSVKWREHCERERDPIVEPILVIQVEDGSKKGGQLLSRTDLDEVVRMIEDAIGRRLGEAELAHAFNEVGDQNIAGRTVRRIEASRIEDDTHVRVVLFKLGLSTGWDCPRAEVMMSFRPAHDHTYIAQLLGRMVRTPLARRIPSDASLNDVHLLLPNFDRNAVEAVIQDLHNVEDVPPTEIGTSREMVTLSRRSGSEAMCEALGHLVTYRVGTVRKQTSLRRLIGLARASTFDGIDEAAFEETIAATVERMTGEIKSMSRASGYAERVANVAGTVVTTVTVSTLSGELPANASASTVETAAADIDQRFEIVGRTFGNGLHMAYWQAHSGRDAVEVKIELILLAADANRMTSLEADAESQFDALYEIHRRRIDALPESRRMHYERLRLAAAVPKDINWQLPEVIDFRRTKGAAPYEGHLYVEADGQFRCDLGPWERSVLEEELARRDVVGWLRNVDRKLWSLEIPYMAGPDYRPMFPDLVIVRRDGQGFQCDVLEPHDPSLKDNFAKAKGLATFAERHGRLFSRIQMIRKTRVGGHDVFRRLDVNRVDVRKRVLRIANDDQLDELFKTAAV